MLFKTIMHVSQCTLWTVNDRAATANFWQARHPQWRSNQGRAYTAVVAAASFYTAKSRQGGLVSHGRTG